MFAYSIYETGREVERNHSQMDWDSDITGKGHAVTNVQSAELASTLRLNTQSKGLCNQYCKCGCVTLLPYQISMGKGGKKTQNQLKQIKNIKNEMLTSI